MFKPNEKNSKVVILILLLLSTAFSFFPCIKIIKTYVAGVDQGEVYVEYCSYLPAFFCIVSLIEILLLLIKFISIRLRVVGSVLTVFKIFIPIFLYKGGVFDTCGGLISTNYHFSLLGWILVLLGLLTVSLYIVNIICHKASKRS